MPTPNKKKTKPRARVIYAHSMTIEVDGVKYWHCGKCHVEVKQGERCRHCGKTKRAVN